MAARIFGFSATLWGGALLLPGKALFATDLIAPGIHAKAAAGGGQTVSRGSASIFFNPANLIFAKHIEPSLDVSIAKVSYTYAFSDAEVYPDPVTLSATSPPITAGVAIRLVPNFAFGASLVPTGSGAGRVVKGVPLFIPGANAYPQNGEVVDIFVAESGFRLAAGSALRLADSFILGLGVIYMNDTLKQYQVAKVDEEPFLDIKNKGTATQFVTGLRSELFDRRVAAALSLKSAVQKKYKGDYLLDLSNGKDANIDFEPTETMDYLPLTVGLGLETKMGPVGLFLDYVREQWSGGRKLMRRGLPNDPLTVDLVDTNNICAGLKFWPGEAHMLMVSVGIHGANVGDGSDLGTADTATGLKVVQDEESTQDPVDETALGMSFGNLEGIKRTVLAGGYRLRIAGRGYFEMAAQLQRGKRTVPEGFSQEGTHSLQVLLASAGIGYGF